MSKFKNNQQKSKQSSKPKTFNAKQSEISSIDEQEYVQSLNVSKGLMTIDAIIIIFEIWRPFSRKFSAKIVRRCAMHGHLTR